MTADECHGIFFSVHGLNANLPRKRFLNIFAIDNDDVTNRFKKHIFGDGGATLHVSNMGWNCNMEKTKCLLNLAHGSTRIN